jgi:hypothetical protein
MDDDLFILFSINASCLIFYLKFAQSMLRALAECQKKKKSSIQSKQENVNVYARSSKMKTNTMHCNAYCREKSKEREASEGETFHG